ncbi:unnamed protein product [Prorocentrum cordatum]|uniref:SWIM-type domain-containing protein n=1 Tax=Prorocentrum cordatum TaxID=2364126 RepID=A0ABN9W6C0_9DINO|nr:unnamed protein product [Polarella glacialis]
MSPASRICRFRALQDVLDDLEPLRECPCRPSRAPARRRRGRPRWWPWGRSCPTSRSSTALHLVDAGDSIHKGGGVPPEVYEVRGGRESHLVVSSGLYCSCPYFGRQVLEAGELCCKHWLAVQLARRCRVGLAASSTLGEDEFAEWMERRLPVVAAIPAR